MTPAELSSVLRRVASKLASPDVGQEELNRARRVLATLHDRMNGVDTMDRSARRIAAAMVAAAMEEVEVSFWDGDEGTAVDDAYKAARKEEEADRLESALKLLGRKVDQFVKEIQHPSPERGDDSDVFTSAPPV